MILPTPEEKPNADSFSKAQRLHPLVSMLPDHLKKPENYDKIKKAILNAGATKHSHGEVADWAGCKECQQKQLDRLRMMKGLGFRSAAQYKIWDKIHAIVKGRAPLPKYNELHTSEGGA